MRRINIPTEEIVRLYESGLTMRQVAAYLGVSKPFVNTRLKRAGIKGRPMWFYYSKTPTSEMIALYKSGLSTRQIAARVDVTKGAVIYRLRNAGVKMRKYSDYQMPRGPAHHGWKGGRCLSREGYVLIHIPGTKGWKLEHRLVMERQINRRLRRNEYIHHINGIRDDNRIENLALTSPKKHEAMTLIRAQQKRIRDLESEIAHLKSRLA